MSSATATPRSRPAPAPGRSLPRAATRAAIDFYNPATLGWVAIGDAPLGCEAIPAPRGRGAFLTLWLGLMALGVGWGVASNLALLVAGSVTLPGALSAILGGVALVGLVGLWAWRGWGLHAVGGAALALASVTILFERPLPLALLEVAGPLVLTVAASGRAQRFA